MTTSIIQATNSLEIVWYMEVGSNQGEKDLSREECSKSSDITDSTSSKSATACFDCYICLDVVVEPVVTLCGHLYCWPCICKWLQLERAASRHCPVCKASLSLDTFVPLYGRSDTSKNSSDTSKKSYFQIPFRSTKESVLVGNSYGNTNHHYHPSQYTRRGNLDTAASLLAPPSVFHHSPAAGLVGGLLTSLLPWAFRGQGGETYYSNSRRHQLMVGGESPRSRRYQMQMESSLQQTWLLLLCFATICLVFF